jgi:uncharacterized protein with von Willebrand factor type A (vWA) domain
MFVDFLYELRETQGAVGAQEAVALAGRSTLGLHESSLDGFYEVARALLVHDENSTSTTSTWPSRSTSAAWPSSR